METSGEMRRRLVALGHDVISCDLLPADDGGRIGRHIVGDVFETLDTLYATGWWPDAAIFHPTCTYLTISAEWAYGDPNYDRYPGVGYHQRVKAGTLVGALRRAAREEAVKDVYRLRAEKIRIKVFENPIGHLSKRIGRPTQIVQPYEFGDDASKATCLWVYEDSELLPPQMWLPLDPQRRVSGRLVGGVERWANQTDAGQNRLSPGVDRWKERSRTFPGIADALAQKVSVLTGYIDIQEGIFA